MHAARMGTTNLLPLTEEQPDSDAIITTAGSRTWRQLEQRARRFAHALADLGLGPNDRWALLAQNRVEWPELVLGNLRAGTRFVPLNWHLTVPELEYLLRNSDASAMVVDPDNAERGRAAALLSGIAADRIFVLGPEFDEWVDSFPDDDPANEVAGASLLYTGGTTGASKGVIRSDTGGPISAWPNQVSTWGQFVNMPASGTALMTTPLYHAFGQGALNALLVRRHSVILAPRFDAHAFLQTVQDHGVTSAPLVPTLMVRLAKLSPEERAGYDVSTLQWICHTAAPCPAWAKQTLIDWMGPIVTEFYGSSEGTGPVVCSSQEWMDRPGTVGKPNPRLEATVVDDDGNDVPVRSIGTLYFRRVDGPPVYHGDQDKTDRSRLPDGRFTVGDVGWMDEDGYVYLADRRVDLILSGGANVYPAEIEAVILEHPDVRDAAVFGIPHPEFGEEVKAAVELQGGATADAAAIIGWCRTRLASYKCPKTVDFHEALPREASGKLKKRYLRDVYWPAS